MKLAPYLNINQLRYYIPLSAPPTRAPLDGNEAFIRPELGFSPSWFHKYCDIDFGQTWHRNPEVRLQAFEKMRDHIKGRFPGRNIGGILDDKPPDLLTGVYGAAVLPALFGHDLVYYADRWPAHHGQLLSDREVAALEPLDWDRNEIFDDLLRQADSIEKLTGSLRGFLNWQGVLNMAFRLRGQQIFLDMLDDPKRADHLFVTLAESLIQGIKKLYARQKASGVVYEFGSIANCVVNMLSPKHYAQHILPCDRRIRRAFKNFGIHNCAWNVDPYVASYATIPQLGYIDMGLDSNLGKVRELLPQARRNVLYTSMDLKNKSRAEIKRDFKRIARECAPCDVGLPDLEMDVPDDRIRMVFEICEALTEKVGNTVF